jgi:hypothetical protein
MALATKLVSLHNVAATKLGVHHMGRPPIGKVAMTSTERSRRYRAGLATKPAATKPAEPATKPAEPATKPGPDHRDDEIARLKARIAELEKRGAGAQLTRSRHDDGQTSAAVFGEVGKLRGENAKLKSDIIKLKMMLQEEPDAAKLRKKVVDQQVEMASMRAAMKRAAKERDEYKARVARMQPKKYGEARGLLKQQNYAVIVKALHSDRAKYATAAELAEAERLFIGLRPLFIGN